MHSLFRDRSDAGLRLANSLRSAAKADLIIMAIPFGGIAVAAEVGKNFGAPINVCLTTRIVFPEHSQLSFGTLSHDSDVYLDQYLVKFLGLNQDQIDEAIAKAKAKLSHANSLLSGLNAEIRLAGKDILIVDDVIATGLSVLGAVRHLERLNPLSISVASPVISRYASARLSKLNVEHFAVIVGEEDGFSPSNYYNDFKPISEQKAVEHMRNFHLRFS